MMTDDLGDEPQSPGLPGLPPLDPREHFDAMVDSGLMGLSSGIPEEQLFWFLKATHKGFADDQTIKSAADMAIAKHHEGPGSTESGAALFKPPAYQVRRHGPSSRVFRRPKDATWPAEWDKEAEKDSKKPESRKSANLSFVEDRPYQPGDMIRTVRDVPIPDGRTIRRGAFGSFYNYGQDPGQHECWFGDVKITLTAEDIEPAAPVHDPGHMSPYMKPASDQSPIYGITGWVQSSRDPNAKYLIDSVLRGMDPVQVIEDDAPTIPWSSDPDVTSDPGSTPGAGTAGAMVAGQVVKQDGDKVTIFVKGSPALKPGQNVTLHVTY